MNLRCQWTSWTATGPRSLRLDVPPFNVPDLIGTIQIAQTLMPDVTSIVVFEGGQYDVEYVLEDGGWRSHWYGRTSHE